MSQQQYLLTCNSCARPFPISAANAGDRVVCVHCGETCQAPSLREIRSLPPADDPLTSSAAHGMGVAIGFRWLFLAGAILFLGCGIAAAILLYRASQLDTTLPTLEITEAAAQRLNQMSPEQLASRWEGISAQDLTWVEHPVYRNRRVQAGYQRAALICGIVAACGAAVMLTSIILGRQVSNPPR